MATEVNEKRILEILIMLTNSRLALKIEIKPRSNLQEISSKLIEMYRLLLLRSHTKFPLKVLLNTRFT